MLHFYSPPENIRKGAIEVEHWLKIFQQCMLLCRNIYRNNDNINVPKFRLYLKPRHKNLFLLMSV